MPFKRIKLTDNRRQKAIITMLLLIAFMYGFGFGVLWVQFHVAAPRLPRTMWERCFPWMII